MATAKNTLLSATHTRKLEKCANVTGYSVEILVARAVSNFLSDEAPILMDRPRKTARKLRSMSKKEQSKPSIVSRNAQSVTMTNDALETLLRDWTDIMERGESDPMGSFTQPEVDRGISYLDEEFNA